jgi:hypothetical protein
MLWRMRTRASRDGAKDPPTDNFIDPLIPATACGGEANAGTQIVRRSGWAIRRSSDTHVGFNWVPAFAGMSGIKGMFVAALAFVLAAPAFAQAPARPPAPDFYATVALAGFEHAVEVRQSATKRRVDVATGGVVQTFLTDRARGALVVMTAAGPRRVAFFFPLALGEVNPPLPLDFAEMQGATRLNRIGSSSVAGRPCALWRYVGYLNRNGVVCATAEGVVLQLVPDGRKTPLFQVLTITFARQDPRWFAVPPDYQIASLPGVGGVAQPPPAAAAPAAPTPQR